MTTTEILHRLSDLGVATTATPDGFLDLEPADRITSDLLEQVRAHKPALIEMLSANPWAQADARAAQIVAAMQSKSLEYAQLLYQDGDGWHALPHAGAVWGVQSAAQFLEATRYARTRQPHPLAVEIRGIRKGSRLETIKTFTSAREQVRGAA
jgi:hypothetical protein